MKSLLRSLLVALAPLSAWAQVPQLRETVDPVPAGMVLAPPHSAAIGPVNRPAAACAVTTTLDFAQRPNGEDWKNHDPIVVDASPRNTTIETAGTYVEPTGGTETALTVQANTTNNLKVGNLFWSTNYTSKNNATTQITYSFNRPVNNFSLTLLDVDRNTSNFIDAVTLDAYRADGSVLNMSASNDASVANNTAYTTVSGNTITGILQSVDGEVTGDVTVTFNKPITRFTITYRNTFDIADPGVQYIGITKMTWCTQANVATTLSGPARANIGSQVTYTATTTASGDYDATGVKPVVQLSPGLNSQSPVFPAGSSYNNTTGLLTLATIPTLAVGTTNTAIIRFNMPSSTVTGRASSTIDTDDADPSDNNGSLAAANVTTTTNQAPTAEAKSAAVLFGTASITKLPAMTGTDPNNDPLTYTILGSSIVAPGFGVVSYVNSAGIRTDISGTSNVTLTAAQAATLEFKRGTGAATSGTFQYFVSDPFGGVSSPVNYVLSVGDQSAVYSSPNAFRTSAVVNGSVLATVSDPDGGITSTTFTQTSGALVKGGITFSANGTATAVEVTNGPQSGRISLPPAGTYVFSVTTTDSRGGQTISSVTITIVGTDRAATYSTQNRFNRDALGSGMTLATLNDPDAPVTNATLNAGPLANSMTLDATTGQITVNSTSVPFAGTYTYTVNTRDAAGGTSTAVPVTITVFDDTEAIYAVAAAPAGVYNNNDVLATVSDADGAVNSASNLSGTSSLPPGVSLNPATGQFFVSDRPLLRQGTYPVQVRTTDVTGGITTQTVNLVIKSRPLPVTLTNFSAKAAGADAQLNWATAQEINNDRFVVERSFDGSRFAPVAEVKGQGTTSAATSYSLTDAQVASKARVAYYRLRQVDKDGTSTYSSVEMVAFATTAARSAVAAYPNPASSLTNTRLDLSGATDGTYQVSIVDLTGRVLRRFAQAGGSNERLDVTSLPAGTYLVQVQGNGQSFVQRLIKE